MEGSLRPRTTTSCTTAVGLHSLLTAAGLLLLLWLLLLPYLGAQRPVALRFHLPAFPRLLRPIHCFYGAQVDRVGESSCLHHA